MLAVAELTTGQALDAAVPLTAQAASLAAEATNAVVVPAASVAASESTNGAQVSASDISPSLTSSSGGASADLDAKASKTVSPLASSQSSGTPGLFFEGSVVQIAVVSEEPATTLSPVVLTDLASAASSGETLDPLVASGVSQDAADGAATPASAAGSLTSQLLAEASDPVVAPAAADETEVPALVLQDQPVDAAMSDPADVVSASRTPETFSAVAASDTRPTDLARAATTENIRAELWEVAKRVQNLQRVEAVVATALGDLAVIARHSPNGVTITLSGEAAAAIDLTALQNELPGLDVSVDLSQKSRAPEWDQDTVISHAPQRAQQVITSTIERSSQSQLDILA
jgi:hypothetical protein